MFLDMQKSILTFFLDEFSVRGINLSMEIVFACVPGPVHLCANCAISSLLYGLSAAF